jgi:hypothetical protein
MFGHFMKWLAGRGRQRNGAARRQSAALEFESLEDRTTPSGLFVAGVGGITQAVDPEVSLYATAGPMANQRMGIQLEAFATTFGDARVAVGDVNHDGTDDVIAAAGVGGGSEVMIFDGAAALHSLRSPIAHFYVYSNAPGVSQMPGFGGGVFVASADLNGDGFAELITTPGMGGRGHLKVLDFNDGNGNFLGSNPTLRASVYTFTDYDGEIRVTTMRALGEQYVVTASGAGVPGDVRAYQNAYNLGQIADRTMAPMSFLAARLVPFGGYSGGLSVAAGDVNGGGDDELIVSKNDGASTVEIYKATDLALAFGAGNVMPAPMATFTAFPGFMGEVRLGASDVDGDGKVEVLTTTGWSGDPQGTPVKAFSIANNFSAPVRSFYSNPGYLPGAWLAGNDFTFAQDVTTYRVIDNNVNSMLPATFESKTGSPTPLTREVQDVDVAFPNWDGMGNLPAESVTGAAMPFRDVEVSLAFDHQYPEEATVSLVYSPGGGGADRVLTLYSGPGHPNRAFTGLRATFTDNAPGIVPDGASGQTMTGRFQADGGSLRTFVNSLPDRNGVFCLVFEDTVRYDSGTVPASPAPMIRLLY